MTAQDLILTLKKNRVDLEHSALMQDRGIILGLMVGFPFTVANLLISMGLQAEPRMLGLVPIFIAVMGFMEWMRRRVVGMIRLKQAEIEGLIRELEGSPEPPAS